MKKCVTCEGLYENEDCCLECGNPNSTMFWKNVTKGFTCDAWTPSEGVKATIDRVLEIIDKRIKWCGKNYSLGEFIPDVYVLTLVEQDIKALKGGQK